MPNITSLSEFRKKTTAMVKEVTESGSPLYLTQNGKASVVVISAEMYEKSQKSQAMMKLLSMREAEADAGEVFDFDDVLTELDAMIESRDGQ